MQQIWGQWLPNPEDLQGGRRLWSLWWSQNSRYMTVFFIHVYLTFVKLDNISGFFSHPVFLPYSYCIYFLPVDGIVSFLKKQAGPASVELKDEADMVKFGSGPEAIVVGELTFGFYWDANLNAAGKLEDLVMLVWMRFIVCSQVSLLMTRAHHRQSSWRQPAPWGTTIASPTPALKLFSKATASMESKLLF